MQVGVSLDSVGIEPIRMETDEQTRIGMVSTEARNSESPPIHAILLVLQHLRKTQRKTIGLCKFRSGFPFPPAVVMLSYAKNDLAAESFRIRADGKISWSRKLFITPACGEVSCNLGMIRLRNQPRPVLSSRFQHSDVVVVL